MEEGQRGWGWDGGRGEEEFVCDLEGACLEAGGCGGS